MQPIEQNVIDQKRFFLVGSMHSGPKNDYSIYVLVVRSNQQSINREIVQQYCSTVSQCYACRNSSFDTTPTSPNLPQQRGMLRTDITAVISIPFSIFFPPPLKSHMGHHNRARAIRSKPTR